MEKLVRNLNRRRFLGLALISIGSIYAANILAEKDRQQRIWEYESNPPHPFKWDMAVRFITDPVMKLLAGGMTAHHWDWKKFRRTTQQGTYLPSAEDRYYEQFSGKNISVLDHAIGHTMIGIKDAYILGIDVEGLTAANIDIDSYHIGYSVGDHQEINKCRILISAHEKVRFLTSTAGVQAYALDRHNNELPLVAEGPIKRNDPKYRSFRQI